MNALVVGGGIGGLATALALTRGGVSVHVVEKSAAWDVYGVGIIQPGNALRALDQLGLADACVAAGHPIRGDRTTLADGVTVLAEHDWPSASPRLPPGNGIPRPKLHEILVSASSVADTRISWSLGRGMPFPGGSLGDADGQSCSASTVTPSASVVRSPRIGCPAATQASARPS